MLFDSWLWAQVSYNFNLEESHSVMGWLQLSSRCSAANHKAKQLEKASGMAQELRNKGEKSFDCFGSSRTPGEQNPGETNIPLASLGEQRPNFTIPQGFAADLPCLQGFSVELQALLSARFAAGRPTAELSQPTGPCGVLAATCSLCQTSLRSASEHQLWCE